MPALAVARPAGERRARLDEQDAARAVEGGIGVRELVAEDERGVAHPPATAR